MKLLFYWHEMYNKENTYIQYSIICQQFKSTTEKEVKHKQKIGIDDLEEGRYFNFV